VAARRRTSLATVFFSVVVVCRHLPVPLVQRGVCLLLLDPSQRARLEFPPTLTSSIPLPLVSGRSLFSRCFLSSLYQTAFSPFPASFRLENPRRLTFVLSDLWVSSSRTLCSFFSSVIHSCMFSCMVCSPPPLSVFSSFGTWFIHASGPPELKRSALYSGRVTLTFAEFQRVFIYHSFCIGFNDSPIPRVPVGPFGPLYKTTPYSRNRCMGF